MEPVAIIAQTLELTTTIGIEDDVSSTFMVHYLLYSLIVH
jgi:hypothetical protein